MPSSSSIHAADPDIAIIGGGIAGGALAAAAARAGLRVLLLERTLHHAWVEGALSFGHPRVCTALNDAAVAAALAICRFRDLRADFSPEGRTRRQRVRDKAAADLSVLLPIAATQMGPYAVPPESFTQAARDRLLG